METEFEIVDNLVYDFMILDREAGPLHRPCGSSLPSLCWGEMTSPPQ